MAGGFRPRVSQVGKRLRPIARLFNQTILIFFSISWVGLFYAAAAEPVQVVIEGLEGDALKNVQAALAIPPGVVSGGSVDRALLELFRRQIPEKVKKALEPFGYYEAQVSSGQERKEGGQV